MVISLNKIIILVHIIMNVNIEFQQIDELNSRIWSEAANDPVNNLKAATVNLDSAVDAGYELGQAESLLNIGYCLIYTSKLREAGEELNKALDLFRMIQDPRADRGEIRTLNALGVRAAGDSDYETALNFYFMTLTRCEQGNFDETRVRALNNIGEIHRILNNIEEALSYYHQASVLSDRLKDKWVKAITLGNIAEVQLKTHDFDSAELNLKTALEIAEDDNFQLLIADCKLGMSRVLIRRGSLDEAGSAIDEAEILYKRTADRNGRSECVYRRGVLDIERGFYREAENSILEAEEQARNLNNTDLIRRCLKRMAQIRKNLTDYRSALEYYEKFNEIETSQRSNSLKNRLKKITIMFETEQTETEKEAYRMQSLQLEKTNKEIRFINEIGKEITSSLDPEQIITSAYRQLKSLVDITTFGVAIYNEDSAVLDFHYVIENDEKLKPISVGIDNESSIAAWCVRNREQVVISSRRDAERYVKEWKHGSGSYSESAVYIPIISRNSMVGCLTIQSEKPDAYSDRSLDLLGAVTSFVGIALENSVIHNELNKLNEDISNEKKGLEVAYRKIAHMANHDSLTNLPNRHLLHELLESGIKTAHRETTHLAVLYMDLDRFKPINDNFGHDTGDIVLTMVGDRLTEAVRTSDTVARIGGDEYVVVLYNVETASGISAVSEKIIASLNQDMEIGGNRHNIGVSIGISIYPEDDISIEGLLLKADKAMYKAKQAGKNRAAFYRDIETTAPV